MEGNNQVNDYIQRKMYRKKIEGIFDKENIAKYIFLLIATLSIIFVLLICIFLLSNSLPIIREIGLKDLVLGLKWKPNIGKFGILPMIVGSILVTLLAILIAGPIGLFTAIFLSDFCPKRIYKLASPLIHLMSGVPSVVYGFFGLVVLVPLIRENLGGTGLSLLTAGILLSLMILPTIITIVESALRQVDKSYYEASLALGASHEETVFRVKLRAAKSSLLAAMILGLGRAIGETTAVIMVIGNQVVLPKSVLKGVRTLTTNIVLEMGYATDLHRSALIATASVLFVFILIINISFNIAKKRGQRDA